MRFYQIRVSRLFVSAVLCLAAQVSAQNTSVSVENGSILTGAGVVEGAVQPASGGRIVPGNGVGTLTVSSLTLNANTVLELELTTAGNDKIAVTGNGQLTINGGGVYLYQPGTTNSFSTPGIYQLLTYAGTLAGSPANLGVLNPVAGLQYRFVDDPAAHAVNLVIGNPTPTPTPTASATATPTATATATPTATPGTPTRLANISTRLRVETGNNVLIGGFIITGSQSKKVIVRALGPSVPVPGALTNPTLELYSGSDLIASNDDWQNQPPADRQAVIDSTIPPTSDLESALVRTLPANSSAYTAIVRGANSGTGVGVVEVYDLDGTVDSKLANISTRGFVQTGDNLLIAGTIILGQNPQKVIVRAIGPSLSVPGKMEYPTLELRDQNGGLLEANDNWVDSPNKQAIIDSTIPPTNDKESAIVRLLPANLASYTAILRGVNDTTGIAVVEVYALQ